MKLFTSAADRAALFAALLGAMMLFVPPVRAAPDEIRVVTDDLTDQGDISLELHAASVRAREGASTQHLGQGILELSYGVSEALEVSVQLPFSKEPGFRANGANFELQYVAPHDKQTGPYWGARVEIGNARAALEPKMSLSLEARPIFGYRTGSWHGTLNLSWRFALSGENHQSTFEPSAKLTRGLTAQTRFGVELYRQAAQRPDGASAGLPQRKLALLVVDTKLRGISLSVGAGRGVGAASDGPVVKLIAGMEI